MRKIIWALLLIFIVGVGIYALMPAGTKSVAEEKHHETIHPRKAGGD